MCIITLWMVAQNQIKSITVNNSIYGSSHYKICSQVQSRIIFMLKEHI